MGVGTTAHLDAVLRMEAPDLYSYLDYRRFLRDWFGWKKENNPKYSHRLFARRAGQRSPSLLLLVIDGRRNLTTATTAAFAAAMDLRPEERTFFGRLVDLDQAETEELRAEALSDVLSTRRWFREARQVDDASVRYFQSWWFPAIHELANREDFRPDPGWIASALVPPIQPGQAAEALQALLDLGLLARTGDGPPRPTDQSVVTPHEVAEQAFLRYHGGMLDRAREAVDRFDQGERHLLGLTMAVPESMLPELKGRLNELQRELLALCDRAPKERVYQLEIALFPLSIRRGGR